MRFETDTSGVFSAVDADTSHDGATYLGDLVVPTMVNAHSHAFQRALAGRTERSVRAGDSFWSWRDAMYGAIASVDPDAFEAATYDAFATMARAGYGHVCEFHYVHNDPRGRPYDDPNELAHRVVAAAAAADLGLTLLPVLYRFSDFGGAPPLPHQARFVRSLDAYAEAWLALRARYRDDPRVEIGIAPHSLRAVDLHDLHTLVALARAHPGRAVPFHIHVAEQEREVAAARAHHGTTPIELLAREVALDEHWCLVHATHASADERAAIARAGAVVALCPTTEANLGDGIFATASFVGAGGRIAIGSDSNVSIDVAEELRWLEYAQRLALRERNVLRDDARPSVARFVYETCAAGGAQAAGAPLGALAVGRTADALALGATEAADADDALARAVFRSGAWRIDARLAAGVRR